MEKKKKNPKSLVLLFGWLVFYFLFLFLIFGFFFNLQGLAFSGPALHSFPDLSAVGADFTSVFQKMWPGNFTRVSSTSGETELWAD